MAIVKCANGHFYNNEETPNCPYCNGGAAVGETVPLGNNAVNNSLGQTVPLGQAAPTPSDKTVPLPSGGQANDNDVGKTKPMPDGRTIIIDHSKTSDIKPVRGWLVVIDGKNRGMDLKIYNGLNSVGRNSSNDICIDFDQTVTGEKACFVAYDDQANLFYMVLGESKNLVRLNKKPVFGTEQLKDNDIIQIGETKFVFRALCNENFDYPVDGVADEK